MRNNVIIVKIKVLCYIQLCVTERYVLKNKQNMGNFDFNWGFSSINDA